MFPSRHFLSLGLMYEPFTSAVSMSTAGAVRSPQGFFKMEEKHMQKQVGLIFDSFIFLIEET